MNFVIGSTKTVAPEDQYAVELSTYKKVYGNGKDWAVGRLLPNAKTKQLAGVRQGDWYEISTAAPTVRSIVRITGYGTDDDKNWTLKQQTHSGPVAKVDTYNLFYSVDSMVSFVRDANSTNHNFPTRFCYSSLSFPSFFSYYSRATPVAPSSTKLRRR
jgi:hypothetical protein